MSEQQPQPRRRRIGQSLGWDADDIAQAATVGPGDADAVAAWWDKHCPKIARGLISAEEVDDE